MREWIKKSDRQPKLPNGTPFGRYPYYSDDLLFTNGKNIYVGAKISNGFESYWHDYWNDDNIRDEIVTHWMPLPKLPDELSALDPKINFEFEGRKYRVSMEAQADGMIGLPDGRVLKIYYLPETSQIDFKLISRSITFGGLVQIAEEIKED